MTEQALSNFKESFLNMIYGEVLKGTSYQNIARDFWEQEVKPEIEQKDHAFKILASANKNQALEIRQLIETIAKIKEAIIKGENE